MYKKESDKNRDKDGNRNRNRGENRDKDRNRVRDRDIDIDIDRDKGRGRDKNRAKDRDRSHYFVNEPELDSRPSSFEYSYKDSTFIFKTDKGVFSKDRGDYGSKILIDAFVTDQEGADLEGLKLLDLGCGYGFVGAIVKRLFPGLKLHMSDINERAVKYARENILLNKLEAESISISDAFDNLEGPFDLILLNPPIRSGKENIFKLYEGSWQALTSGGSLYVVIQTKQGASSTLARLEKIFGSCDLIGIKSGYRVFKATRA